ncbi:membrane protein [Microbacterium phage Pickles13]|nr:membrane protein [Microbacterium phage Pickles13]
MSAREFMLLAAVVIGAVLAFVFASFENALVGFGAALVVSLALWAIFAATERGES